MANKKAQAQAVQAEEQAQAQAVQAEEQAQAREEISVSGSYLSTMNLETGSAMSIVSANEKGLTRAKIEIRTKDGSKLEEITLQTAAAVMTYGRIEALTRINQSVGVALCAELAHARKNNIFKDFNIDSFGEWVERVFGLSRKTAELYARIGETLVKREEIDGKASYKLLYGLEDFKNTVTVGHLLELLKLFADGAERPKDFNIPDELQSKVNITMYVSTKKLREAVKKYVNDENAPTVTAKEINGEEDNQPDTDGQDNQINTDGQDNRPDTDTQPPTVTKVDSKESALNQFANALNAFAAASMALRDYVTEEEKIEIDDIIKRLSQLSIR